MYEIYRACCTNKSETSARRPGRAALYFCNRRQTFTFRCDHFINAMTIIVWELIRNESSLQLQKTQVPSSLVYHAHKVGKKKTALRRTNIPSKPPPATRHRGVLQIKKDIHLFDMRSHDQKDNTSKPIMVLGSIVSFRVLPIESLPDLVFLALKFFPSTSKHTKQSQIYNFDCNVVMPSKWSPKMYLGAIQYSIDINCFLALRDVTFVRKKFVCLNEINTYFLMSERKLNLKLTKSGAYISVKGGKINEVSDQNQN